MKGGNMGRKESQEAIVKSIAGELAGMQEELKGIPDIYEKDGDGRLSFSTTYYTQDTKKGAQGFKITRDGKKFFKKIDKHYKKISGLRAKLEYNGGALLESGLKMDQLTKVYDRLVDLKASMDLEPKLRKLEPKLRKALEDMGKKPTAKDWVTDFVKDALKDISDDGNPAKQREAEKKIELLCQYDNGIEFLIDTQGGTRAVEIAFNLDKSFAEFMLVKLTETLPILDGNTEFLRQSGNAAKAKKNNLECFNKYVQKSDENPLNNEGMTPKMVTSSFKAGLCCNGIFDREFIGSLSDSNEDNKKVVEQWVSDNPDTARIVFNFLTQLKAYNQRSGALLDGDGIGVCLQRLYSRGEANLREVEITNSISSRIYNNPDLLNPDSPAVRLSATTSTATTTTTAAADADAATTSTATTTAAPADLTLTTTAPGASAETKRSLSEYLIQGHKILEVGDLSGYVTIGNERSLTKVVAVCLGCKDSDFERLIDHFFDQKIDGAPKTRDDLIELCLNEKVNVVGKRGGKAEITLLDKVAVVACHPAFSESCHTKLEEGRQIKTRILRLLLDDNVNLNDKAKQKMKTTLSTTFQLDNIYGSMKRDIIDCMKASNESGLMEIHDVLTKARQQYGDEFTINLINESNEEYYKCTGKNYQYQVASSDPDLGKIAEALSASTPIKTLEDLDDLDRGFSSPGQTSNC